MSQSVGPVRQLSKQTFGTFCLSAQYPTAAQSAQKSRPMNPVSQTTATIFASRIADN